MKILIVDDSKAMRQIVRRSMRQAGFEEHEYLEAGNGVEALAVIREHSPDLILSDWNMPDMTGIELLNALRAEGRGVKFGFITSEGSQTMRETATQAGASFLVAKPFTPEMLKAALDPIVRAGA
jgi:two-component system chemotaxis response regulator CheY